MQPELIANYHCETGEGPLWHATEKRLYWVDIPQGRLFRYHPASGTHEIVYEGEVIGGFTVQADGALLLFMAKGAIKLWCDGVLTTVIESIPGEEAFRFNDVIADPAGRVFCGTMTAGDDPATERGRLYRLDTDGTIMKVLDGIGVSNGMGFTPDRKQMYYTDSFPARTIYRFDYDEATGAITNQQVFATVPEDQGEGIPDGMTVDVEGYVWSARWDGHCLVRYAPDGGEDRRILFPTSKKISSAVFGGDDYNDLYVTTAGGHEKEANGPDAGFLFRVDPGVSGVPEFLSRIGL